MPNRNSEDMDTGKDDDILEITEVKDESKQEEERKYARQVSNIVERESILRDEMKFMANFDPGNSVRRQKKNRRRRRYFRADGRPIVVADEYENCDCLEPRCTGCHFPCKNCGDLRCGHECRVNRRWVYETVEIEGRNKVLRNPNRESIFAFEGFD